MWQHNYSDEYLCHWGIKGMKWGVRRYQNKDGTLTPAGKKRYQKLYRNFEKNNPNRETNYIRVMDKQNTDRLKDTKQSELWKKAFAAGKGSKEWDEYEEYVRDFNKKYADDYAEAIAKDYAASTRSITDISESGKKYIAELFKQDIDADFNLKKEMREDAQRKVDEFVERYNRWYYGKEG